MRGEVLRYDDTSGQGLISGDDGVRYSFARADLQQLRPLSAGMKVDFVAHDGAAREIFMLDAPSAGASAAGALESSGENLSLWGYFWKCMRKSFSGEGRARRKEYWSFQLFVWISLIVVCIVGGAVQGATGGYSDGYGEEPTPAAAGVLAIGLLLFLAFIPAAFSVTIRRLHDIGLTGWLILLLLIPYLGGLFIFVCALIDSERRTNKHGLYPKPL